MGVPRADVAHSPTVAVRKPALLAGRIVVLAVRVAVREAHRSETIVGRIVGSPVCLVLPQKRVLPLNVTAKQQAAPARIMRALDFAAVPSSSASFRGRISFAPPP